MSSIDQYLNLGVAGVALYLMYQLSAKALDKIQMSLDANTIAINELKSVVARLCDQNGKATN